MKISRRKKRELDRRRSLVRQNLMLSVSYCTIEVHRDLAQFFCSIVLAKVKLFCIEVFFSAHQKRVSLEVMHEIQKHSKITISTASCFRGFQSSA
jgi:hypothetical protein